MRFRFAGSLALLFVCSLCRRQPAAAKIDDQFRAWLARRSLAGGQGERASRRTTFDAAFAGVKPNLKLPDLVMPGEKAKTPKKQHQAEFGSPGNYFAEKTIGAVAAGGRARAGQYAAGRWPRSKSATACRASVVLAIWGRESGFGAAKIPYDAFEVLGTKAFLPTRKDMFRTEVLAALDIVERGLAPRAAMSSSWAGALGQPQFMPTSFLKHAVDFDGDGQPDIWNSVPDTLASIANYLVDYGWVKGRDWGFEVTVPDSVSCALEGPDQGKKIADWAAHGHRAGRRQALPGSTRLRPRAFC